MNTKADPTAVKVMTALALLAEVEKSLRFLAAVGVVKSESIVKGCRKFVKDHPEIQAWIDKSAFSDDEGSNVFGVERPPARGEVANEVREAARTTR